MRRQWITAAMLFIGYAAYYFCRVNLSVATPLLIVDLHSHGMSVANATLAIGTIVSLGTLAYAVGKFFLAGSADFVGGKRNFLIGALGAVAFTLVFATGNGLPIFTLAWVGNRLLQSIGWAGLVKVSSKWFPYSAYARVMAILSLSFLVGDVVTRSGMGALIALGFGWRALFLTGAGALAIVAIACFFILKESSVSAGFRAPDINPNNLFATSGDQDRPANLRELLRPLFRSTAFRLVCVLSFGTTLLREAFSAWTPTFFTTSAGFTAAKAAAYSSLFPAAGVIAVLAAGWIGDRVGSTGRSRVIFVGLTLAACALAALASLPKGAGTAAVLLVAAVGLFNTGPYSYLAGATALDFGGRKGSAITSAIIDGVGYLGGALSGVGIARLELAFGWGGAFFALAALCFVTALGALALARVQASK